MSRVAAVALGVLAAAVLVVVVLVAPVQVRHSAPFGASQTFDPERGLAVRGGYVVPNYPNFDRVDLDLRSYVREAEIDLTVNVRPAEEGAAPIRSVPLPVDGDRIWHEKGAFADPYVTVRFPPIADAAGRRYYVWIETGPRNREDVVTVWSIKSYSTVAGAAVARAWLGRAPGPPATAAGQLAVGAAAAGMIACGGWLVAALAAAQSRAVADDVRREKRHVAAR